MKISDKFHSEDIYKLKNTVLTGKTEDIKWRIYHINIVSKLLDENKKEIEFYLENLNKNLSLIEKVKKFKLIKEEFTIENGMLTPTLKLRRKKILEKYKQDLEKLY